MKKIISIFIVVLALAIPLRAQVFMIDDDHNLRTESEDVLSVVPLNGVTWDQTNELYTPLGNSILLLAVFGGAYLLRKKTQQENN